MLEDALPSEMRCLASRGEGSERPADIAQASDRFMRRATLTGLLDVAEGVERNGSDAATV